MGLWNKALRIAALSLVSALLPAPSRAAAPECARAFRVTEAYVLGVHETPAGIRREVIVRESFPTGHGITTFVTRREVREGLPSLVREMARARLGEGASQAQVDALALVLARRRARADRDRYLDFVAEQVGFAVGIFERRRNWSPAFRAKLLRIGRRFARDSTYATVVDDESRRILGVMRYIEAPYVREGDRITADSPLLDSRYRSGAGFRAPGEADLDEGLPRPPAGVPAEEYLDIEVGRPGAPRTVGRADEPRPGRVVEIGNLAIDESLPGPLRARVWVELWLQTVRMLHGSDDPRVAYYGQSIVTYADPYSLHLYGPMGFEYIRSYVHRGQLLQFPETERPAPIVKEGVRWWPMIWRPEQAQLFNLKVSRGEVTQVGGTDVASRRRELGEGTNSGAEALEAAAPLIEALAEGGPVADAAALALARVLQTFGFHKDLAKGSFNDREVGMRAIQVFQSVAPMVGDLQGRLTLALRHENPEVRRRVAQIYRIDGIPRLLIELLGEVFVVRELERLLEDPDEGVRAEALKTLAHYPSAVRYSIDPILEELDRADPERRREAAERLPGLLYLSLEVTVPDLRDLVERMAGRLASPDPVVRAGVLAGLLRLGPAAHPAIPAIRALLARPGGPSLAAVQVIEEVGGARAAQAVPELVALLREPEAELAQAAAGALARIGPPARAAAEELARTAHDRARPMPLRLEAIRALGSIALGDRELLRPIQGLARAPLSRELRDAVRAANARRPGDFQSQLDETLSFSLTP